MEKKVLLAGTCPICGGNDLNYDERPIFNGDNMMWSFECCDCNAYGYEEHSLVFQGTMISGNSEYGSTNTFDTYYNAGSEIDAKKGGDK